MILRRVGMMIPVRVVVYRKLLVGFSTVIAGYAASLEATVEHTIIERGGIDIKFSWLLKHDEIAELAILSLDVKIQNTENIVRRHIPSGDLVDINNTVQFIQPSREYNRVTNGMAAIFTVIHIASRIPPVVTHTESS